MKWRQPIRAGLVRISQGQERPLIDGCRESEVSRECLTGDTVYWLWNGFNALDEPQAGGSTGARSGPLGKRVLYYKTHLA